MDRDRCKWALGTCAKLSGFDFFFRFRTPFVSLFRHHFHLILRFRLSPFRSSKLSLSGVPLNRLRAKKSRDYIGSGIQLFFPQVNGYYNASHAFERWLSYKSSLWYCLVRLTLQHLCTVYLTVLLCFHRCDSFNPPITCRTSCELNQPRWTSVHTVRGQEIRHRTTTSAVRLS